MILAGFQLFVRMEAPSGNQMFERSSKSHQREQSSKYKDQARRPEIATMKRAHEYASQVLAVTKRDKPLWL
jgi:hypothetical protein